MMPSTLRATPLHAACLVLLVAAPAARAQGQLTGWTTVERTTTDSGAGHTSDVSTMRRVTAGGRTRMASFVGSDSVAPMMIMITDSAAGTIMSVMPAQHTAMLMAYPGEAVTAMKDVMKYTPVGKPDYHVEDLGDGPPILGHPTHHYRTTSHMVMRFEGPGFGCERAIDSRDELWTTLDSIGPRPPRRTRPAQVAGGAVPALDSMAMANAIRVRGHPLRSESVMTETRGAGAPVSVRHTSETTMISYGPVDSAEFRAPPGYRVIDQRAMMARIDQRKMFEAMAPAIAPRICGEGTER